MRYLQGKLRILGLWLISLGITGERTYAGNVSTVEVWIRQDGRYRHVYIQGATNTRDGCIFFDGVKGSIPNYE